MLITTFFDRDETESRDSLFSDSFSDESESEKLSRWDGCSSEEGDSLCHMNDRWGYLYFQYFERSTPYGRVPLMDKVSLFLLTLLFSLAAIQSLLSIQNLFCSWCYKEMYVLCASD